MTVPSPSPSAPSRSPSALLAAADTMLAAPSAAGVRHRATAFLLRMALEVALRRYWERVCPELADRRTYLRVICLEFYGGAKLAGRWSACWNGLSRACHYHDYGFVPTAAELWDWREEVAAILDALSAPETGPGRVRPRKS